MSIRSCVSRLTQLALIAGFSVWCAGPASAGGGGEDRGSVQMFLDGICSMVGQDPCPQLPTISQGILEIAGLFNARPEAVRYGQNVPGSAIYAGNAPVPEPAANSLPSLASLTPLAFVGALTSAGTATPTQLYNTAANSFFYAVTTLGSVQGNPQPKTLHLVFDYLQRTVPTFIKGQVVAKISLPLVVLKSDGSELAVCGAQGCPGSVATLQITATCTGGPACLAGTVQGDFTGGGVQATYPAAALGVTIASAFGASPVSKLPHAIFDVSVPLVVTMKNDEPYFAFNPVFNAFPFTGEDLGSPAPVLGQGVAVGVAPYGGPLCDATPGAKCADPLPPATFSVCASFSNNTTGPFASPAPAVGAFVQIATDGEALASAPLSSESPAPRCLF